MAANTLYFEPGIHVTSCDVLGKCHRVTCQVHQLVFNLHCLGRVIYGELAVRAYDWDTSDGSPPRYVAGKHDTSSDDDNESTEGVASSGSRAVSVAGSSGDAASPHGRRATLVMDGTLSVRASL
jgi:hypothetical protein